MVTRYGRRAGGGNLDRLETGEMEFTEDASEVATPPGSGSSITFVDAPDGTTLLIISDDNTLDLGSSTRVINAPLPEGANDLARKGYVDGVAQGLALKDAVEAAADANVDLASATDPNPIDGHTLSDGDRVLLKGQSDGTENGIYIAQTATDPTTWTRSPDADEDSEVTNGTFTFVENGTNNGDSSFIVTSDDPITLGTTAITWSQFANAGEITAGTDLTKSGSTLNHDDTSSQGNVSAGSGSAVTDVTLDGRGHVTGIQTSAVGVSFPLTFPDNDGDGSQFDIDEDATTGDLRIRHGGAKRFQLAQNGDLNIEGSLTEGAAL